MDATREQARRAEERVAERLDALGPLGRTVLELWRYLRTGTVSSAVPLVAGRRSLAGAIAGQRPDLQDVSPVVVGEETRPLGTLGTLELYEPDSSPATYSYLLRRRKGRWIVIFDTLTQSALEAGAQKRLQNALGPKADRPSAPAVVAKTFAAERTAVLQNGKP
jgi:hypothetical protein